MNTEDIEKTKTKSKKNVSSIYLWIKRVVDIVCSLIAIIILSPVFLIIALTIKVDSPGPVFFKQKRVGIHKSHFVEDLNSDRLILC